MKPKTKLHSLLLKFSIIFVIISVLTLGICGVSTYINQNSIYREQLIEKMRQTSNFICKMIQEDGAEFVAFQEYLLSHADTIRVPLDVTEWEDKEVEFKEKFHKKYPGRTLESDMDYEDLSDDMRELSTVYNYEYWMHFIEDAMAKLDLEYAYYLTPVGKPDEHKITYPLDIVPDEFEENGVTYRVIGSEYEEPPEEHKALWETWETGEPVKDLDEFDNEYGHTYAYYAPLIINDQKLGLVGAEVTVEAVNKEILSNTLRQLVYLAIIQMLSMALILYIINRKYIRKLEKLSLNIRDYATNKDAGISNTIKSEVGGNDEISALARQTAEMIVELDSYMQSLVATTQELDETREHAERMNELATKDALTGIRNKTAYAREVDKLAERIRDGLTEFGIAMIDLNYLKNINDNYGHEYGNEAIKRTCRLACNVFKHSPIFRVGGDEFVVILTDHDYDQVDALVSAFNYEIIALSNNENLKPWERISAALGYALYIPGVDYSVEDVFRRADQAMYEKKKKMHAEQESLPR